MSLTLLLGGAASGKSRLAVARFERGGGDRCLIATAAAGDAEMAAKIARHRRDRDAGWSVIEEQVDLVDACSRVPDDAALVVDCLTLWVSNLMAQDRDEGWIVDEAETVAIIMEGRTGDTVVVSNEVGSGIVPENQLARRYRDILGRVNRTFAAHCDQVFLVVAGRMLPVLPADETWT